MAKSKPSDPGKRHKKKSGGLRRIHDTRSPEDLLVEACTLHQQSQSEAALPLARRALLKLNGSQTDRKAQLPALLVLAQISLDIGDPKEACKQYLAAVQIDPLGEEIGAEPFLWLAQLCEEGGQESISWFQKGLSLLRQEVSKLEAATPQADTFRDVVQEKKQKMVGALCGMVEVYMTDLSLEPNAESNCEAFVTEALLIIPNSPTALQTQANVRISQLRCDDAKSSLRESMSSWLNSPPETGGVPDFSSRISLSRLLMEVEMESEALIVLERLVQEEDQSVEAWYLGGWCQYLQSRKGKDTKGAAAEWLKTSLRLYDAQDYEDIRLRDHAEELLHGLASDLGDNASDGEDWEDEEDNAEEELGDIEVDENTSAIPGTIIDQ